MKIVYKKDPVEIKKEEQLRTDFFAQSDFLYSEDGSFSQDEITKGYSNPSKVLKKVLSEKEEVNLRKKFFSLADKLYKKQPQN